MFQFLNARGGERKSLKKKKKKYLDSHISITKKLNLSVNKFILNKKSLMKVILPFNYVENI